MGTYTSQSDIENVFGESNVAIWSNLDNTTTTADTARIAQAITVAEAEVEDLFRGGRYALPFSPATAPKVVDWCAKKAGIWLYRSRPQRTGDAADDYAAMERAVMEEIADYQRGARKLLCAIQGTQPTAPTVVTSGGGRSRAEWGAG